MTPHNYSDWDASYLLGALSATERREFERHLTGCAACSVAVAELAGLPGLLAKVPASEVESLIESPSVPVPDTLLPRLVRSVARRRRRMRGAIASAVVAASVAAAAIALAVPFVPLTSTVPVPTGPVPTVSTSALPVSTTLALAQVVPSAFSADVRLVPEGWGTRLEINCRYGTPSTNVSDYDPSAASAYAMFVTDASGRSMQVATWTATPGSTVEPLGTTSLAVTDIRSVDVRSSVDGRVLLRGTP